MVVSLAPFCANYVDADVVMSYEQAVEFLEKFQQDVVDVTSSAAPGVMPQLTVSRKLEVLFNFLRYRKVQRVLQMSNTPHRVVIQHAVDCFNSYYMFYTQLRMMKADVSSGEHAHSAIKFEKLHCDLVEAVVKLT